MNLWGTRPHIPIIEEFDASMKPDLTIYKMPLYNSFQQNQKPEDAGLFNLLRLAQKEGDDTVYYSQTSETYEDLAFESRKAVLDYLKQHQSFLFFFR